MILVEWARKRLLARFGPYRAAEEEGASLVKGGDVALSVIFERGRTPPSMAARLLGTVAVVLYLPLLLGWLFS